MTYDLDLQSPTHMEKVEVHGQSVPKIEWKQTDRRTDGGDCITSYANAVGDKERKFDLQHISAIMYFTNE